MTVTRLVAILFMISLAPDADAQVNGIGGEPPRSAPTRDTRTSGAILESVPAGDVTESVLRLTVEDAIGRALRNNPGLLNGLNEVDEADGARRRAKSQLLPHLTSRTAWSSQQINVAAFGFTGFPDLPSVVGPFPLFDTRLHLSQSLLDFDALNHMRAETMDVTVASLRVEATRTLVVLTASNLYLPGVAAADRIAAGQVQHDTAQTLYDLAAHLKAAGLVASIDVLRAELQRDAARQRVIVAERDFEKAQLTRNRFAAGVASNIEVVEAQESVATATDNHISARYAQSVAKRPLAHAIGATESRITESLGVRWQ